MNLRSIVMAIFICSMLLPIMVRQASAQQPIPLNLPNGLAFDRHGNFYVANAGSNQVLVYNPQLVQQTSLTISAGIAGPNRLAFDTLGDLYVSNGGNNSITAYDTNLRQINRKTITQQVNRPLGVVVDAYGDVFVANNGNDNITEYDVDGVLIGKLRQDVDGRQFLAPGALAIEGMNLFVATGPTVGSNFVTSYNVGEFLTLHPRQFTTFSNNISGPTGIAFDDEGNVYVADFYSGVATKYSPSGTLLLTIRNGTVHSEGIAVDRQDNIYVSNEFANTITIYDPSGHLIKTLH
jgi:sugar lactone lactonase YvrE